MIVTVSLTAPHGPLGSSVVKVSITVPLVTAGVYVDVNEFIFEKLPLGALHVPLVAPPPTDPLNVILPPEQTSRFEPASTVAAGLTTMVPVCDACTQAPSVVTV